MSKRKKSKLLPKIKYRISVGVLKAHNLSSHSHSDDCVSDVRRLDVRNISKYVTFLDISSCFQMNPLVPVSAEIAIWAVLMPKNMVLSAIKAGCRPLFLCYSNKNRFVCKTTELSSMELACNTSTKRKVQDILNSLQ